MANKKIRDAWDRNHITLHLHNELYPNEHLKDNFLILKKNELEEIIQKTKKRIAYYNKNLKKKCWAGYSEWGRT